MVQIIAEIGVNHNGSLDKAFELVDVAIEPGVVAEIISDYYAS
jgi:sialic acid synthase SpsE